MKLGLIQPNPWPGDFSANCAALVKALRALGASGADCCLAPGGVLCGMAFPSFGEGEMFFARQREALAALLTEHVQENLPPLVFGIFLPPPCGSKAQRVEAALLLAGGRLDLLALRDHAFGLDAVFAAQFCKEAKGWPVSFLPELTELGSFLSEYPSAGAVCRETFERSVPLSFFSVSGRRYALLFACDCLTEDEPFTAAGTIGEGDLFAKSLAHLCVDGLFCLGALHLQHSTPVTCRRRLQALALRAGRPVAFANLAAGVDGILFYGSSEVMAHDGRSLGHGPAFAESLLTVPFTGAAYESAVRDVLSESFFSENEQKRKADGLIRDKEGLCEEDLWLALCMGLRDFVRKNKFSSVVFGLSGGIDSALVAALAAEALGPDRVNALLLPSCYSSAGSVDDSLLLADNLGIAVFRLPIEVLQRSCQELFASAVGVPLQGVAEENIQSRIRGVLLMAYSNQLNAMLLTTGNKSELAVGYCTLYGDMNGGLALIGDVYKTEVYRLCRWLNQRAGRALIPELILEKEPSAELRPEQRDADTLPPYFELDTILRALLEEGLDEQDVLLRVGDAERVRQVCALVRSAEFKRRQAAMVLRVSTCPFESLPPAPLCRKRS